MSGLYPCAFDGNAFVPIGASHLRRAREEFGAGEIVTLSVEEERSAKAHRYFFASLRDLWQTLPERYAHEQWAQSPEHLRAYALIRTGYSETQTFVCGSAAEATRWAANMRPLDAFSIVLAKGATVVRYTAKSQAVRAMPREEFQASSAAVLEWLEDLIAGRQDAA